jgi:uncharacterized Zn finger protein
MPSVADLVEPDAFRERAGEYLSRAGETLRAAGHVRIVEFGPVRIAGQVDDGPTRTVTLAAGPTGLATGCDCGTMNEAGLCPHVVAVAFETWERAPKRGA